MTTYQVCAVLAGAYRGGRKKLDAMLTHYEVPGTNDALCGRLKPGDLCDVALEVPVPSCKYCLRAAAKAQFGSVRMTGRVVDAAVMARLRVPFGYELVAGGEHVRWRIHDANDDAIASVAAGEEGYARLIVSALNGHLCGARRRLPGRSKGAKS